MGGEPTKRDGGQNSDDKIRQEPVPYYTSAPSFLGLPEDGRDLFGLAAHKLNTPLACIRGFAAAVYQRGDELDSVTVQQFMRLIIGQTDRIQELVRDFLLLARVSGDIVAFARPFRPHDIVLSLIDELGDEGARIQIAGHADTALVGDAELVRLALRPIVENCLTYGPRLGLVTVTITAMAEHTLWEVHDQGTRLSPEALSQLFRPFNRSDDPPERRGSGAGLGLTLARAYAETLDGSMGARVDETGTVFWLDVPVVNPTERTTLIARRVKAGCGCRPRRVLSIRQDQLDSGSITCGTCGQDFRPQP
jgi:signal transduction histidine kinase